jgi:hypothetical protein
MAATLMHIAKNGWMTVKAHLLALPPCCVSCLGRPDHTHKIEEGRLNWLLAFVTLTMVQAVQSITVDVPVCRACLRRSQWKGRLWGIVPGLILGGVLGFLLIFAPVENRHLLIPIFLLVGALFGFMIGGGQTAGLPVQIKRYSPKNRTIMIRFGNPQYQERFIARMTAHAAETNPFAGAAGE